MISIFYTPFLLLLKKCGSRQKSLQFGTFVASHSCTFKSLFSKSFIISALLFSLISCHKKKLQQQTLFQKLSPSETHINFSNTLSYDSKFNIYIYRNFYNGGGVAIGDINNDGLPDIFFTANMLPNRLFLNKGNMQFEDITEKAGIVKKSKWSTGVSMADVNGDGFLDIYVCNSGDIKGDSRQNELYINNGFLPSPKNINNPLPFSAGEGAQRADEAGQAEVTFTEKAVEYGLDDKGLSTHAAFFDYDHDGDLDMFLLNNSFKAIGSFNLQKNERDIRDPVGGDKLYRNDENHFIDASAEAGIYGSTIGFGLGVTVGDVNSDGWQDVYVSNDFFERDYLYINQKNGTFKESLEDEMMSISNASMGADMADINNDANPDIFVTEMLPEDEGRIKTNTTFENWDKYQLDLKYDYYHQFTRNMLQLNNGVPASPKNTDNPLPFTKGKGAPSVDKSKRPQETTFSEIGRFAGVSATDWSWGAIITDLDNDGYKDIFVANGIYQDLTNEDYIQYISNDNFFKEVTSGKADYKKLIDLIPSRPIANYAFSNNGDLTFTNKAKEWGLDEPGFSNGSAYSDLDNDGDLDLVVNNVNMPCFIYRNESVQQHPENKFLRVSLRGAGKNRFGTGAKVTVHYKNTIAYQEQMPMRGFESTVDNRLNFGLGETQKIDSVVIQWPDGKENILKNIQPNQQITVKQSEAVLPVTGFPLPVTSYQLPVASNKKTTTGKWESAISNPKTKTDNLKPATGNLKPTSLNPQPSTLNTVFTESTDNLGIGFRHQENTFVDFDRDKLIFQMLSTQGPRIAKGDVNKDGLEDLYICGAKDQPGVLYIQTKAGRFTKSNEALLEKDKESEDTDALFFDADKDGDEDLYVCSGGNEFSPNSTALINRLYLNNGKGNFTRSPQILPSYIFESTSCVTAGDYDSDGDQDLFVGVRLKPFSYGYPCKGYLLQNDGKGIFTDVTQQAAPELLQAGMVTDAKWFDYDKDGQADLVVTGEYMPVKIFHNDKGRLREVTQAAGLAKTNGWWNRIVIADINSDGYPDIIAGNHGLNSRFKCSDSKPVSMYVSDFDKNGSIEQIVTCYNKDSAYPMVLRHDLVNVLPSLKKKYLKYESYKEQTMQDIFTKEQLSKAVKLEAYTMQSSVFINNRNGVFQRKALPAEAQFSPMYGIAAEDFDKDGNTDIMMGGNFYESKPEAGIYDASYGVFLKGDGKGNFKNIKAQQSGYKVRGAVRDIKEVKSGKKTLLLIALNNSMLKIFNIAGK